MKPQIKLISNVLILLLLGLILGLASSKEVRAEIDLMGLTLDVKQSGIDV